MTITADRPLAPPVVRPVGSSRTHYVVARDPQHGSTVAVVPGCQLGVQFHRPLGASRWRLVDGPDHLVPLTTSGHEFSFLVFASAAGTPSRLRFERSRSGDLREVRELLVVPVTDGRGRTSRRASRRTASR